MITATTGLAYHVTADEPQLIAELLEAAERSAQERALREGNHGILVTRHGPTSFTVALSADVPYGVTQERDLA
jgi:ribosomal protein S12 methylthiotransferase accessory factor YcaO